MENVTDYRYDPDYYEPYPTGIEECEGASLPRAESFLAAVYCVIFAAGFLGNGLLLSSLGFKCRLKRQVDVFIWNLALADLVFLVTLPLWVDAEAGGKRWRSGLALCRLSGYAVAVNAYSSVLFLSCMSLDRYLAIVYPLRARRFRSKAYAALACLSVWLTSLLLGLPVLRNRVLHLREEGSYCGEDPALVTPGVSLAYLLFTFLLPMLVILICYCSITRKLCLQYRRGKRQDVKLRKSLRVVFMVVLVFLVSWLPFNVFRCLALIHRWGAPFESCGFQTVVGLGQEASAPLAFANSCVNPFIYWVCDSSIRKALLRLLLPCLKPFHLSRLSIASESQPSRSSSVTTDHSNQRARSAPAVVQLATWATHVEP
ncbi:G-protein coupled receptor 15-like [Chiloscyllium plagiosum]|uniref:G-protein coupled receptor 15-like n=1 Tax=Chiloscyllium plagiosum TaxID=36176 RepID=UPI001CB7FFCF|nr:G-protein coupled receptor 15-like [Chiloscyllium plagiosum]